MKINSSFKEHMLCDVARIVISNVDKVIQPTEQQVRLCNYTDVYYNSYIRNELNLKMGSASESEIEKFSLKKGDVVITKDSESSDDIAVPSLVVEDLTNVVCGYHLAVLRPDRSLALGEYLLQLLEDESIRYYFFTLSNGVTRYGLTTGAISHALLPLPPLPEQQKIAEILGACDEAIEAQERLIAQKQQRKKGLMQKLLTGDVRFPEFEGTEWKELMLSDQLKETPRKVKKPDSAFKTAGVRCHARGIFAKPDMHPDDIALEELFEIKTGDVVVNISFAWEHAIAVADESHDGALVSHRFPTFVCRTNVAASSFFKYFVQLPRMRYDLKCVSPGGAGRNRVLNKKDFKKLRYLFPAYQEQVRIGSFLDACSEEISLQQKQLEQLKQQKKGLMQQLLTGKVRVKV